jgi:regulator of protease activity HflC (stomatin/prohibitin superfamily)
MPPREVAEMPETVTILFWLAAATALVATPAVLAAALVPPSHRAVVLRLNRLHRVRGPGLVPVVPLLERRILVPVGQTRMETFVPRVRTADGVTVSAAVAASYRVTDPALGWAAPQGIRVSVADALEWAVRAELGRAGLAELTAPDPSRLERIAAEADHQLAGLGVTVGRVELAEVELPLTPEFAHWARSLASAPQPVAAERSG